MSRPPPQLAPRQEFDTDAEYYQYLRRERLKADDRPYRGVMIKFEIAVAIIGVLSIIGYLLS